MERLTALLAQQAVDSQRREERMSQILERVISQREASNDHEDDQAGTAHTTPQQVKFSAGAAVAPPFVFLGFPAGV